MNRLKPYQKRLLNEYDELRTKLNKLSIALLTKYFNKYDSKLLKKQRKYMLRYLLVLQRRLRREGILSRVKEL